MGNISIIRNQELQDSLKVYTRQYLVGNLKDEQQLNHIHSSDIEIGFTSYKQYSIEKPHTHKVAYEYQYIISGYTIYLDLDTYEEYHFKTGDFYLIEPGTKYAQKSKANTQILFIKIPAGNDKINIIESDFVNNWFNKQIESKRIDYFYSNNAPMANSIKPAVSVILQNNEKKILVLKRKDNNKWTLPGGTLEFGENLTSCAVREIKEETGLNIEILDLIGTYTNPNILVEYLDGEIRQEFTLVYIGKILNGSIKIDNESKEYKWVTIEELLNMPLAKSQKIRIIDIKEYFQTKQIFLK